MSENQHSQSERVIFFHKHHASARTRFLRFNEDTVCGFSPLPKLSSLVELGDDVDEPPVATHPAVLISEASSRLNLPASAFEIERDYKVLVDVPDGAVRVSLVRFTAIDPPFDQADAIGAHFIDLTQARDLPPVELLLLRRAYEVILGG